MFIGFCLFFSSTIKQFKDPRNPEKIKYPLNHLICTGILLFLCKLGSRRQIKYFFNTPEFINNLNHFAKTKLESVAHPDTLEYSLERLSPKYPAKLRTQMNRNLIRNKYFENSRLLNNYYLIAVDGTGFLSFNERHCPHCLKKKHRSGKTIYYHHILDAKLVTANGFSLSIATEFIENPSPKCTVQDCELKAAYRLFKTLKRDFPQLRICLLMDSLYAAGPVFDVCKKNKWAYIVNFKEGSIPTVYAEFEALKIIEPKNKGRFELYDNGIIQKYKWAKHIAYQDHFLNVMECAEPNRKRKKTVCFVWLTNLDINKSNFHKIANQGGRLRWKIENEGFNTQKNGGYNMEHAYSLNNNALKNYYILLQIAHTISQLMEKSFLLKELIKKVFGSIKNFSAMLLEAFRNKTISELAHLNLLRTPFQIRLDSS